MESQMAFTPLPAVYWGIAENVDTSAFSLLNIPFLNHAYSRVTEFPLLAGRNRAYAIREGVSVCLFAHSAPLDQFPPNLEEMVALSKLKVLWKQAVSEERERLWWGKGHSISPTLIRQKRMQSQKRGQTDARTHRTVRFNLTCTDQRTTYLKLWISISTLVFILWDTFTYGTQEECTVKALVLGILESTTWKMFSGKYSPDNVLQCADANPTTFHSPSLTPWSMLQFGSLSRHSSKPATSCTRADLLSSKERGLNM